MRNNSRSRTSAACRSFVSQQQLAVDARVADFDERRGARRARGADQFDGELIGHINHVQQHAVALLQCGGILHQQLGQFFVTRIGHKSANRLIWIFPLSSRFDLTQRREDAETQRKTLAVVECGGKGSATPLWHTRGQAKAVSAPFPASHRGPRRWRAS